jgi:LPS-assembly protein
LSRQILAALGCVLLLLAGLPDAALAQSAKTTDPTLPGAKQRQPSTFGKGRLVGPSTRIDKTQPLYLQGDELIYDSKGDKVTARGNVEIYYNNYILTADEVTYDQTANTLTAQGNVTIKEPSGHVVRAERYTLSDDFREGFAQSLSVIAVDDTRIAARRAIRRDGNITEFESGKFSPCKSDPGKAPLWCISAARIVHDQQQATITYQDAQLEFFGVPVLYVPYFQHADPSVKRKTGFLLPEFSTSSTLGFTAEVPYYIALAPNYDITFHPMYSTRQGVLWQLDWRHRVAMGGINGQYHVKIAAIDQDVSDLPGSAALGLDDGWRGSVETRGKFSLASWWTFGWDITIESDDTFRRFYKLDNILQTDRINSVYLVGQSARNYFAVHGYHFGALTFADTDQAESRVHPVVDWNYVWGQPVLGGELSWNVNAVALSRDSIAFGGVVKETTAVNRVTADVHWRRKLIDQLGITYTPFANLRGDVTQHQNVIDPANPAVRLGEDTIARGVASAGVLAAYPWIASTARGAHIVEPIGQIIGRTAKVDQRRLPDEDARSLVFDDTNLFDLDKFSGYDRIETGTRANVGLQYTFQSATGGYARLLAGQSFHISGQNAFQNPGADGDNRFLHSPASGLETRSSDYVLGAYLSPFAGLKTVAQARFDEGDLGLRRADVFTQAMYGPFLGQLTYAFMAADPILTIPTDQQDIFAMVGLRLTDRWSLLGSIRYDIDDNFRIQDSIQLRYADECFVLTLAYTETFVRDAARGLEPDRTLMFRFELKHLGEFKYKTDQLDHLWAANQPNRN